MEEKQKTKMQIIKDAYNQLQKPFPEETIERTKKEKTRKGYDTTGIKYQFIVNRLNNTLGPGCFKCKDKFEISEGKFKNGSIFFDAVCELEMEIYFYDDDMNLIHTGKANCIGGHRSSNKCDAMKGAYTNAFKKTAAFFGVGRQAYEGTIDDDNIPADWDDGGSGSNNNKTYQMDQNKPTQNKVNPQKESQYYSIIKKAVNIFGPDNMKKVIEDADLKIKTLKENGKSEQEKKRIADIWAYLIAKNDSGHPEIPDIKSEEWPQWACTVLNQTNLIGETNG